MEERLRIHVEEIFKETTPTKKAVELKEEMIQNLTEKYTDLTAEGKTPEAAYNIAVAGIGDISGLLKELEDDIKKPEITVRQRQKAAMLTAIAIMLYILAVLPLIILDYAFGTHTADVIGISLMFIFVAAATGLLIYNGMTKPKYIRGNDTVVEEFRQWKAGKDDRKTLRGSISAALWSIIVALYFIISFATGAWFISWIIFIIGAAIEAIINIAFTFKK
jgi:hypothetical protein